MNIANKSVVVLLCALISGGCGGMGGMKKEDGVNRYIAADFSNALAQIKGMSPISTTLSMAQKRSPLGDHLLKHLRKKGYGIRLVKAREGENPISCESDSFVRGGHKKLVHKVQVGNMSLVREYEVEGGRAFPTSAMSVSGGVAMYSKLNDKKTFNYGTTPGRQLSLSSAGVMSGYGDRTRPPVFVNNRASPGGKECGIVSETHNVDLLGASNYEEIFKRYRDVKRGVVAFKNDSITMSQNSRDVLNEILSYYDKSTDLISVVGVSRGHTKAKNGNSGLAKARAHVLKKLLVSKGVPESKVYKEAGWSVSDVKEVPARGVEVVIFRPEG